jgi:hypothetical protein
MNPLQNPWHWKREHQLVWAGISGLGAVSGLLLGFIHSPFFSLSQTGPAFVMWLSIPDSYWRWAVYGFLVAGVTFYVAQLFRRSN